VIAFRFPKMGKAEPGEGGGERKKKPTREKRDVNPAKKKKIIFTYRESAQTQKGGEKKSMTMNTPLKKITSRTQHGDNEREDGMGTK